MLCGRLVKNGVIVPSPTHWTPMGDDLTDIGSVGGYTLGTVTGSPTTGTSFRKDGTGGHTTGTYWYPAQWPFSWGPTGVSIAAVISPDNIVDRLADGQHAGGLSCTNSAQDSIFCLAFDDWEFDNNVVVPNFTIIVPTIYDRVSDFTTSQVYASARSTSAITTGYVYHLCGTFDASTGEAKLYVNGTLEDTDTISSSARLTTFMEWTGITNDDLENTSRLNRDNFSIGQRFADGSWTGRATAKVQDIKIWEETILDADQVAAEADLYNLGAP